MKEIELARPLKFELGSSFEFYLKFVCNLIIRVSHCSSSFGDDVRCLQNALIRRDGKPIHEVSYSPCKEVRTDMKSLKFSNKRTEDFVWGSYGVVFETGPRKSNQLKRDTLLEFAYEVRTLGNAYEDIKVAVTKTF